MTKIRSRIAEHVQVRVGDLVPHPHNFRRHPVRQRKALRDSLEELGDIRSLLGHRMPDGRIQLIDGHLRRDLDPERLVTVEIVDLTPDEAAKALLTIDPLAALAETDVQAAAALAETVESASASLNELWKSLSALSNGQQFRVTLARLLAQALWDHGKAREEPVYAPLG